MTLPASRTDSPAPILVLEDNSTDVRVLEHMLAEGEFGRFEAVFAASLAEALAAGGSGESQWSLLLIDLELRDTSGLETLARCRRAWPDIPTVILTGTDDEQLAREAVRLGAQDYLVKGAIGAQALHRVLRYAVERHRFQRELAFLERELEQSRRLEAVGHLAAGIAHEINTPVQYVSDNVRFVQESIGALIAAAKEVARLSTEHAELVDPDVAAALPDEDIDYLAAELPKALEQSSSGLDHVARIVRAMKRFAHPENDTKSPADLNQALETAVLLASSECKHVADVELDLDGDLPEVECLAGDVHQLFLNLLVNAAHAIGSTLDDQPGAKGSITVTSRRLDGGWVEFRVRDTGCGIADEHRSRVFDAFFTTKEVGKGTGQGLAIAHDVVVSKHGGELTFEPNADGGTTFVVRLPVRDPGETGRRAA